MNLIFKVVDYNEEAEQLTVKFCREHAPKPIDEYPSVCIDKRNIDFEGDYESFVSSIMRFGLNRIYQQESEEPILNENISSSIDSNQIPKIEDIVNKVVMLDGEKLFVTGLRMNKIKL
jgi:hypothetical protein